jgi:tRNA-splicing ligase RtcB
VLIPGTMGTASYVLAGVPDNPAFFSTAHGAGRVQSRHQAARHTNADALRRGLEESGILVRGSSPRGLAEEKPGAYKDIDAVIETSHHARWRARWRALCPWEW